MAQGVPLCSPDAPHAASRPSLRQRGSPGTPAGFAPRSLMRPEILFPLFAPAPSLPGVGPRLAKLVEKVAGPHVVDLLWHLPTGIVDRRFAPTVADAPEGRIATFTVRVDAHLPGFGKTPYKVRCHDETAFLHLVYFHAKSEWLKKL